MYNNNVSGLKIMVLIDGLPAPAPIWPLCPKIKTPKDCTQFRHDRTVDVCHKRWWSHIMFDIPLLCFTKFLCETIDVSVQWPQCTAESNRELLLVEVGCAFDSSLEEALLTISRFSQSWVVCEPSWGTRAPGYRRSDSQPGQQCVELFPFPRTLGQLG